MKQWILTCIIEDQPQAGEAPLTASELKHVLSHNLLTGIIIKKVQIVPLPTRRVVEDPKKLAKKSTKTSETSSKDEL